MIRALGWLSVCVCVCVYSAYFATAGT